jgi:hypothetical protein
MTPAGHPTETTRSGAHSDKNARQTGAPNHLQGSGENPMVDTQSSARLTELLCHTPTVASHDSTRVEWLLAVADELDGLPVDGAARVATMARTEALVLIRSAVKCAGPTGGAR